MMKKTTLPLAVAVALGSSSLAMASGYQFEVNAGFERSEISNWDDDVWYLEGTAYMNRIDDTRGPLAEAAFLNKASFLTLGYAYLDGDITFDGDRYSIGGEYVVEGSNVILGARYTRYDLDSIQQGIEVGDGDLFAFTLGVYLDDLTTLRLNYEHQDWDDGDIDKLSLAVRHLTPDLGGGMQVAVEGSLGWFEVDPDNMGSDSAYTLGVDADLYVNPQFSVGAGVEWVHGDNDVEGYNWDVRARYFFTPQFSANVAYGEWNPDGMWAGAERPAMGRTVKSWTVGLTGRF